MQLAMDGEADVEEVDANHKSLMIPNLGLANCVEVYEVCTLSETDVTYLWKPNVIPDAIVF